MHEAPLPTNGGNMWRVIASFSVLCTGSLAVFLLMGAAFAFDESIGDYLMFPPGDAPPPLAYGMRVLLVELDYGTLVAIALVMVVSFAVVFAPVKNTTRFLTAIAIFAFSFRLVMIALFISFRSNDWNNYFNTIEYRPMSFEQILSDLSGFETLSFAHICQGIRAGWGYGMIILDCAVFALAVLCIGRLIVRRSKSKRARAVEGVDLRIAGGVALLSCQLIVAYAEVGEELESPRLTAAAVEAWVATPDAEVLRQLAESFPADLIRDYRAIASDDNPTLEVNSLRMLIGIASVGQASLARELHPFIVNEALDLEDQNDFIVVIKTLRTNWALDEQLRASVSRRLLEPYQRTNRWDAITDAEIRLICRYPQAVDSRTLTRLRDSRYHQLLESESHWYKTTAWSCVTALARMGSAADLDLAIQLVDTHPSQTTKFMRLFEHLRSIQDWRIVEYYAGYLDDHSYVYPPDGDLASRSKASAAGNCLHYMLEGFPLYNVTAQEQREWLNSVRDDPPWK